MRKIRFRAWDNEEKWMVDDLYISFDGDIFTDDIDPHDTPYKETELANAERYELMQYTGEDDLELHPIYEGDIVHIYNEEPYMTVDMLDVVIFKNGCFTTKEHEYDFYHCGGDCLTVKGNIYENPELLKGENR